MSDDKSKIIAENENQTFNSLISPNNSFDEENSYKIESFPSLKEYSESFIGEKDSELENIDLYYQNFGNIIGDQNISSIYRYDAKIIQNEDENKNEDKKVEILISSKEEEEDKEKNSTKEEEKKNVKKKISFKSLKLTEKKRKIKYKENIYEYFYDKSQFKHSKFCLDNIRKKIITHFLKFLISLLNIILKKNNYEKKFFNLHKEKKSETKKNINILKNQTIKDILSFEISSKYKCYKDDEKANEKIYKEVLEKFPLMESFFQKTFIDIFNEIYCNKGKKLNKGIIDLNNYNINLIIDLNKENLETYESLIEKSKNKCKNKKESDDYIKKIKKFVKSL